MTPVARGGQARDNGMRLTRNVYAALPQKKLRDSERPRSQVFWKLPEKFSSRGH